MLAPGQHRRMHVGLTEDVVWNHWLFWTLIGAALIGAGVGLYFALRPAPPSLEGNYTPSVVYALGWSGTF